MPSLFFTHRLLPWAALLLLVWSAGCAEAPPEVDTPLRSGEKDGPCFTNQTCSEGLACVENRCIESVTPDAGTTGCQSHAACDDGNLCNGVESCNFTTGQCESGVAKQCDDSDPCNGVETCNVSTGQCESGVAKQCDDGNPCNGAETCEPFTGICLPGTEIACDDNNPCNGVETCDPLSGTCLAGNPIVCNDNNRCNGIERCDVASGGCVPGIPLRCDDSDPCNGVETCNANTGECVSGQPIRCTDDNPCNGIERCDVNTGACMPGPPPVCNDGDACNGEEICDPDQGGCVSGEAITCDDGNQCNGAETCDSATGVCLPGTPVVYDDGDPCNGVETCEPSTGEEIIGDPLLCEDNDPCTINTCTASGCVTTPSDAPGCCNVDQDCSDNDPCNGEETCETATGTCRQGAPLVCQDDSLCTYDDICIPGVGCYFPPVCNDNNRCTVDQCDAETGACTFTAKCDDGIHCTVDSCESETGECTHELSVSDHPLCDDGDLCTVDTCDLQADACVNQAITCAARDACEHEGMCNPSNGQCEWTPIDCASELGVDGSNACEQPACRPFGAQGAPAGCFVELGIIDRQFQTVDGRYGFCDDGNVCTLDTCDPTGGCENTTAGFTPTGACNDDNLCTNDFCGVSGDCVNEPVDIDDGDLCTVDRCNESNGSITHTPLTCRDKNSCSISGCSAGTCAYVYPDRAMGECCDGKFYDYANTISSTNDLADYVFCPGVGGDTKWQFSDLLTSSSGGALAFTNAGTLKFENSDAPGTPVSGKLISEPIVLPSSATVSLEFTPIPAMLRPYQIDFRVAIATATSVASNPCEGSFETVWTLSANGDYGASRPQVVDVTNYAGQVVRLLFEMDSAAQDTASGFGLAVDDVLVTSTCPASPCGNAADCDDQNLCTNDSCVDNACVNEPVVCDDGDGCTESFCNRDTGACEHPLKVCEWDNPCIESYCGEDGECHFDIIDVADDDPCNGTERCDLITGDVVPGNPVVCEDWNLCDGVNTCNPNTGSCESGPPKNCYEELGISPDDPDDVGSTDSNDYICQGDVRCRPSTGECVLNEYFPTPLDDDFLCPMAPEQCSSGHRPDEFGDAPSGYFKRVSADGFALKDRDLWDSFYERISELEQLTGVTRVDAETAIANSNRYAVDDTFWLTRPVCLKEAYSFDAADFLPDGTNELTHNAGWWPQGVSGTTDAYSSGNLNGDTYIAITSYHKGAEGDYSVAPPGGLSTTDEDCIPGLDDPDIDDCSKGVRVSFFKTTDSGDVRYRHMLLVTPTTDRNGNPSIKPVIGHAGGLVWYKNLLYIPQTGSGFRVFDLNHIMELPFDKSGDYIGRHDDGSISAFNYRYVIPEVGRYYKCANCCCARFSFVSMHREDDRVFMLSGEYTEDDRDNARLMEWELDPDTGRMLTYSNTNLIRPTEVIYPHIGKLQGAAYEPLTGKYWVSSNYSLSGIPSGWLHNGVKSLDGSDNAYSHSTILGTEDLYVDVRTNTMWTVGEFPGMRYVTGMDIEEMAEWEPCGCSLAGYTCLVTNYAADTVNNIVGSLEDAAENAIEWVAGWL